MEDITATVNDSKLLSPTNDMVLTDGEYTFSPLRRGGDRLLCNDARLSYKELATLVSQYTGWDIGLVMGDVQTELYCAFCVLHPSGERRSYWSTETRYTYNKGSRRDMIEVNLGGGRSGAAQITAFIRLNGGIDRMCEGVIVRWMSKSTLSTHTDHKDRPLCDFPLSVNHCMWQWSDAGRNRDCFRVRGFRNRVDAQNLWSHVAPEHRDDVIRSEIRARYDIIGYDSILGHANIHPDPSTGHLLQTIQML